MNVEINLTTGQLAAEICRRLAPNTQVKITPRWVRVQHTAHCDMLMTSQQIDQAIANNLLK